MEDFKTKIKNETVLAMKAKNQLRVDTLRSITNAITVAEKSKGNKDLDHIDILRGMVKQRNQSIEQFTAANYIEEANKESLELLIIEEFLPTPMNDSDMFISINEIIHSMDPVPTIRDMGKIIVKFKDTYPGQDMGKVSKILKTVLV